MLDSMDGDKARSLDVARPAFDRVSSRANMDPAMGMPIKAVKAPAAPAYAKTSCLDLEASDELPYQYLAKEDPSRAPAHTMGASGPTENPKLDVTSDSSRSGIKWTRLSGRALAGAFEKEATKSATVNVDENLDDKSPMRIPPTVHVAVIKCVGLRDSNCFKSRLGARCQTVLTQTPNTFPYTNPMAAVIAPTVSEAGTSPSGGVSEDADAKMEACLISRGNSLPLLVEAKYGDRFRFLAPPVRFDGRWALEVSLVRAVEQWLLTASKSINEVAHVGVLIFVAWIAVATYAGLLRWSSSFVNTDRFVSTLMYGTVSDNYCNSKMPIRHLFVLQSTDIELFLI